MEALASMDELRQGPRTPAEIEVPASTAWPIVLAFGFTLVFAGLLTSVSVSALGLGLSIAGCVGWFREVFPSEHEQAVPVGFEEHRITTTRRVVEHVPIAPELLRVWLPLKTYPISAGVKGGVAGAIAMAVLACTYGVLKTGSIWYPINLLAAVVYRESLRLGPAQLYEFRTGAFAIAFVLHGLVSILVGLLYGAMLPMFPRRPILLGGFIAPALWSGLIHSFLEAVNPILNLRIHWLWFVVCQVGFGLVAGVVVLRQTRVRTWQHLPFAVRAG